MSRFLKTRNMTSSVLGKMDKRKQLFEEKTNDYGGAWFLQGKLIEEMVDGKEIICKTGGDISEFQLFGRMLEKMIRYLNLRFTNTKLKVKSESLWETLEDISTQAIMLATLAEENKGRWEEEGDDD